MSFQNVAAVILEGVRGALHWISGVLGRMVIKW